MAERIQSGGVRYVPKTEIEVYDTEDPNYDEHPDWTVRAGFPIKNGAPVLTEMSQPTWNKYENDPRYVFRTVTRNYREMQPCIVRCDCGAKVEIWSDSDTCDRCDQMYNLFGQRIRTPDPRCNCRAYDGGWDCMCLEKYV